MHECRTCHEQTPEGNFCVRCGAPQGGDEALTHARHRHQFAAAPGERRYAPWPISTLFPHLPRHSERHFHVALASGGALVVVLGALRLFPVALISAALLMPLLTVLYFYDVDIYEEEPIWASLWTLVWGAVTGVLVGILAKAISPSGAALIDRGSTGHVLKGGVLIPALGVAVMLAGPLVLLRYRRFNETLDGATFGAATAATFAAAEAIVVGVGVLGGGVRPAGAAAPWVARLVGIAVATPVLSMSAIAVALAAVWLRYRAPLKDRDALGLLGIPAIAIAIAAVLVIAGAIGETFMSAGIWLAWVALLDAVGLVLLRRVLHIGLLEEAQEIEIGPEIVCANCRARTATHTFCANCGISLKALPKARAGAADAAQAPPRGAFSGRLSAEPGRRRIAPRRLILYGASSLVVLGVAFLVAVLAAPPAPTPPCKTHTQCGAPPELPRAVFAFPGYTLWQSSGLGYSLRYNANHWQVAAQDANGVQLSAGDGLSVLEVTGAPQSQVSPSALFQQKVSALQGQLLGLARDTDPNNTLLGTNVGLVPGPGDVFVGTVSSPQGPQSPVSVAIMAAGDGKVSIVATVVAPGNNQADKAAVYQEADDIIDSVQWAP